MKQISTNISFLISFCKTLLAFFDKKRWEIFLCLKTEIPSRVVKYISQRQRPILYVSCMCQYLERHHHSLFLSSSRPQGKPFFRSISIKELSKIYIHKNDNFFYPFRRSYLIKLVIFQAIWYFYRIKQNILLNNENNLLIQNFIMSNKTWLETLMARRQN